MISSSWLDGLFILSATAIWFMIAWQFALFAAGMWYSRRAARVVPIAADFDWPGVSIMVPARNEAVVIRRTIEALLALDYPAARLQIVIVNDGSTDDTAAIVNETAATDGRVRCVTVPAEVSGRGKAAALNLAFPMVAHELIAIYDADNRPEPASLRTLVSALARDPTLAAAVGKFRCLNRDRNLLTRFINIETLAFQWIVQAGRWALLDVTTLPGTNFVMRKSVLDEVGGWDEDALTEDAELSIRIYETGRRIRLVPDAVTWEQEPEQLAVWFRQRRRWARGHNYVLAKHLRRLLHLRPRVVALELLRARDLLRGVCGDRDLRHSVRAGQLRRRLAPRAGAVLGTLAAGLRAVRTGSDDRALARTGRGLAVERAACNRRLLHILPAVDSRRDSRIH